MSYDFSNDDITGSLTTGIDVSATGLTIACYVKVTNHPATLTYLVSLYSTTAALGDDVIAAQFDTVADGYRAQVYADGTGGSAATYSDTDGTYDSIWLPLVATYSSDSARQIYVGDINNDDPAPPGTTRVTTTLTEVTLGASNTLGGVLTGKLAECAIWNTALSTADITAYLGGTPASAINASKLRGYWPLDYSNTTQSNEGLDATGNLTVTGAVYDADHPTLITAPPPGDTIIIPTGPVIP